MANEYLCVSCYEPITNFICERCYLNQIEKWLSNSGLDIDTQEFILEKIRKTFTKELETQNTCIICKTEDVKICSYCFFLKIAKTMKKIGISKEFIELFLADFNYHNEKEEEFMSIVSGP